MYHVVQSQGEAGYNWLKVTGSDSGVLLKKLKAMAEQTSPVVKLWLVSCGLPLF